MLTGEFNHSIDSKGRLIIPSKLRESLGEHFVITKGMDGCLFLYPDNEWKAFEEKLFLPFQFNSSGNSKCHSHLYHQEQDGCTTITDKRQCNSGIRHHVRNYHNIENYLDRDM